MSSCQIRIRGSPDLKIWEFRRFRGHRADFLSRFLKIDFEKFFMCFFDQSVNNNLIKKTHEIIFKIDSLIKFRLVPETSGMNKVGSGNVHSRSFVRWEKFWLAGSGWLALAGWR